MSQRIRKLYYKTFGTSEINSPMFPPLLKNRHRFIDIKCTLEYFLRLPSPPYHKQTSYARPWLKEYLTLLKNLALNKRFIVYFTIEKIALFNVK